MKTQQIADLKIKCANKPQLRTYIKITDFHQKPCFLQKPLSFIQRKFLTKFRMSCLELKICTGRYLQLPEMSRVCLVTPQCTAESEVESEAHFLIRCSGYSDLRRLLFDKLTLPDGFHGFTESEQISILVNNPSNTKLTAQFIIDAFNQRSKLLFKPN